MVAGRRRSPLAGPARAGGEAATFVLLLATATLSTACGADDVEKPVPRFDESPVEYPLELWADGVEGNALVRVLVNEEGRVDSATIAESSGHPVLDSAAVAGAKAMEFDPALKDGEPIEAWAHVPVEFSKRAPESDTAAEAARPLAARPPVGGSGGRGAT